MMNANNREVIPWTLYDSATFANGGTASQKLFQIPVGQSSKTLMDTNMEAAGALPANQKFLVLAMRIVLDPKATVADAQDFLQKMFQQFQISSKKYQEAPIFMYPAGAGVSGIVSTSANDTTIQAGQNGIADIRNTYTFSPQDQIYLSAQQPFSVTLTPNSALSLSGNKKVWVILEGRLEREVM